MVTEPTLGWVSRAGVFTEVGKLPEGAQQADLSPDGNLALIGALPRAYIFDLARRVTTTLNLGSRQAESVSWHPDGKRITIGGSYLSLFDVDTGKETRLTEGGRPKRSPTWSPDGRVVAYMTFNPANDIFMLSMDPGAKPQPLVATDAVELDPAISPDGRLIAYRATSAGSIRTDVYVARFPEVTGRVQITSQGGGPPFWSRDGRELFFGAPPGVLQSVAITPGDQVRVGETRTLFKMTELAVFGPARDGQRFLAIRQPPVVPLTELVVVQNWPEELKRLTTPK
jgi:dipeptidyl aminopeptidase/acylaminoacyl peptidase